MKKEEFEIVYRRHAASVLGYARKCVGRPDIAEEIASDAFLALYRNAGKIDSSQLPAWLYTVVRNRAIDYWRRHRWEAPLVDVAAGDTPPPEPAISPDKLKQAGLSDIHRTCLILRYVEGMTREEIARVTGLREAQVKGHLRYGLELLRRSMSSPSSGDLR
jgi:RNA polymerase sigma-70 factor (ECF subfamily)